MNVGIIYFIVIVIANTIGAISGMGGGVLIKPIFDLIDSHSVAEISFYSSSAVLTMAIVSSYKQVKSGVRIDWSFAIQISFGSILGGILGNKLFEKILSFYPQGREVQLLQILLTILTLLLSFFYSKGYWKNFEVKQFYWKVISGLLLGFLASLLGIGGGPINVALLMFLFNIPIKLATVYSILTILLSQFSKVVTILLTANLEGYDLNILFFIIPAAIIGGFLGAYLSKRMPEKKVNTLFQVVIISVLLLNIYNAFKIY
ncbi:sulfite exporter TauE/SafE family protein [Vagococcus carniphilus]|uniref:Probable membrane transporter protein n=1 Tax=Vagococcus carniphilus TaxID=218144 RepID=A0AAW8U2Y5_9ENTE|nr:sulfite exporter TauE/SafE family protein [Vagococcus carniphilus]MDT2830480.1 sulfite exporter TauE/SafE family protein [Vagococcus carniphilus]MDT2832515.1 sulfite exporter TauE/SafE family protein [Vagococcus carniphilus]MDT2839778.1 sulfite exporter TauE/SafE family protein [Vagococcus carniphilus]